MPPQIANLDSIVDAIRAGRSQASPTVFFVGAGVSVTAGIPSSTTILQLLAHRFPERPFDQLATPAYGQAMSLLGERERREFLGELIDPAQINIAHLYLANLVKHGISNTILTTNFDPLISRSLEKVNIYAALYDIALYQRVDYRGMVRPCVVHLNGQRHGFVLLNTPDETNRILTTARALFADILTNSIVVIVGYSGVNDPLLVALAELKNRFAHCFWVAHGVTAPHAGLTDLLSGDRVFYVSGFDADSFFYDLNGALGLEKPSFLLRPFSYLKESMDHLHSYSASGVRMAEVEAAHAWVNAAIGYFEEGDESLSRLSHFPGLSRDRLTDSVRFIRRNDDYRNIDRVYTQTLKWGGNGLREELGTAAYHYGLDLYSASAECPPRLQRVLLAEAVLQFKKAATLKPEDVRVYNNWGVALACLAEFEGDSEAVLRHAVTKLERALELDAGHYNSVVQLGRSWYRLALHCHSMDAAETAIETLQEALHSPKHAWPALLCLGDAYVTLASLEKDKGRRTEHFRQALGFYRISGTLDGFEDKWQEIGAAALVQRPISSGTL